jgi:hypothetical protein
MKEVLCGKVCDTDTAQRISQWDNGMFLPSASCHVEALYRAPEGHYFLYVVQGIEHGKHSKSVEYYSDARAGEWLREYS